MQKLAINILTDWGVSFVNPNGSFYCGTTEEQKDNAVAVANLADLLIYLCDVHTKRSAEFTINGGLYPAHNLIRRDWDNLPEIGLAEEAEVSPELTAKLQEVVERRESGLLVPRHVYYQDYDGEINYEPSFRIEDVEETFNIKRLNPDALLDGVIQYVLNAKHMFNGAAIQQGFWQNPFQPHQAHETHVLSILKEKYGLGYDLEINITGVVMGICVYQTASGIKQWFPRAKVNIIADSCTHLVLPELGISDVDVGNLVAKKMCQQLGIGYITTAEYLGQCNAQNH